MPSGWTTNATLSHLDPRVGLTNIKEIKATPTLIVGVDRHPFVTILFIEGLNPITGILFAGVWHLLQLPT